MESLREYCVVCWCTLISGNEKQDLDVLEEEEEDDEGMVSFALMERQREATTNKSPLEHLLNFNINNSHAELPVIY